MTRLRRLLVPGLIVLAGLVAFGLVNFQAWRGQAAVLRSDPEQILSDPKLSRTALEHGAKVYRENCASCHGAEGKGDRGQGVPDLTDADHLYGEGKVAEIEDIARHGIRSGDTRGWSLASMPAFASARPYKAEPLPSLTPTEIEQITQYLLAFTGHATDPAAAARGADLFRTKAGCWDCHSSDGVGDASIGAPNLTDDIWLYGNGSHDDIYRSIAYGRAGVSPAFERVLNGAQLRDVAVYVASLQPQPRTREATR